MMPVQVKLSQEFIDGYQQSTVTAMQNLADITSIEMSKLAPYDTGALARSFRRVGSGLSPKIVSSLPYAVRRNYENFKNPQTKKYVERSSL